MAVEHVHRCPICGKPYIVYPYRYREDQSSCKNCRDEAEENSE